MPDPTGHILVVDDNKINRMMLQRMLANQGHRVTQCEDGAKALAYLQDPAAEAVDVVLLDILMPVLDGYELLSEIKGDERLHYLPVIMISALDELDSVVRCIEIGATDYLAKPIQPALLRARLNASLAEKRLRDLELEYLEQVGRVVGAAEAVESNNYEPHSLSEVAGREDALGNLARVFQRMAREVHLREQRLKQQLAQLRLDIEEMQKAGQEPIHVYLPMDRRHALVNGERLPDRTRGTALIADISGFTPMTEAFSRAHGRARGPEEVTRLVNQIYSMLIEEVHAFRGSVISFSGDAITCWFDGDRGLRAIACGLFMQAALLKFEDTVQESGGEIRAAIKVSVVSGPARRFLVGDARIQHIEVLAGGTLDLLAVVEKQARPGEILADEATLQGLADGVDVANWRSADGAGRVGIVRRLLSPVPPDPWPPLPEDALAAEDCRPWVIPGIFERVRGSSRQFLSELRPAAALFMKFEGFDFDGDDSAGEKLDDFVRWVQSIVAEKEGVLLQVTFGDKGSYLYAAFGAPVAHPDDASRAVRAAMSLVALPERLAFVRGLQIGLASGQMRSGAYGSSERRTYGVLGTRVNLAARLMEAADGGILCDETIYRAAQADFHFDSLPALSVKGSDRPVPVYRPVGEHRGGLSTEAIRIKNRIDQLPPSEMLALKLASVAGRQFEPALLAEAFLQEIGSVDVPEALGSLSASGLLQESLEGGFIFRDELTWQVTYDTLLFAQRRQLHRRWAEWLENRHAADPSGAYEQLAGHWRSAGETGKAVHYFELAGRQAMANGDHEKAESLFQAGLRLEGEAGAGAEW